MTDLETAATAAGLADLDLLRLAREGLSPEAAVADLKRLYPGAFAKKIDARTMSREEYRAHCAQMVRDNAAAAAAEKQRQLAEFSARLPPDGVRSMSREQFKKSRDELMGILR